MSRDLNVWLAASPDEVTATLRDAGLEGSGMLSREGRDWLLSASVDRVEVEDIPSDVVAEQRGIVTLVHLNLSPVGSPKFAVSAQNKLAKDMARGLRGAVEDCQTGEVWVPPMHRLKDSLRAARPKGEKTIDVLSFGWWMDHDTLASADGAKRFMTALGKVLPEALPRRFGLWEPPQFRWDTDGLEAFVKLSSDDGMVVAYPTAPAVGFSLGSNLSIGMGNAAGTRAYRARHVYLEIDKAALAIPGYADHLKTSFVTLSKVLMPFYAEVRPLSGYIYGGGRLAIGRQTQSHPVYGPWWCGLPDEPCLARAVGETYAAHWAEAKTWDGADGLWFEAQDDWQASPSLGPGPAPLVQRPKEVSSFGPSGGRKLAEVMPLI